MNGFSERCARGWSFLAVLGVLVCGSRAGAQCYGLWVQAELGAQARHAMTYDTLRSRVILQCSGSGIGASVGSGPGAGASGGTWAWDGTAWTRLAWDGPWPMRMNSSIAYDAGRDRVVLFGGQSMAGANLRDTWEFDGSRWRFVADDGPSAQSDVALVYHPGRGTVVLMTGNQTRMLWEWDGVRWTELPVTPPPTGSTWAGPLLTYDSLRDRLVCIPSPFYDSPTFALVSDQWVQLTTTSPNAISGRAFAYDSARDRITFHCGDNCSGCFCHGDGQWSEFNGTSWSARASTPPDMASRQEYAMVYNQARATSVLYGGGDGSCYAYPRYHDTWEWNGLAWTRWTHAQPGGRHKATAVFDEGHGSTFLFSGGLTVCYTEPIYCYDTYYADAWYWGPAGWTVATLASQPSPRTDEAMAYDAAHGRVVLFGGVSGNWRVYDTWVYNGQWTNLSTTVFESAGRSSMTYDPARARVVLITLPDVGTTQNVWEMVNDTWTLITPTGAAPAKRSEPTVVFDPVRQQVLMFGGSTGSTSLTDTWSWDGQAWTQLSPAGPVPGGAGPASLDADRAVVLMASGTDTWEWNGVNWAQVGAGGPARLNYSSASTVYDAAAGATVLFAWDSIWQWLPSRPPVFLDSPHDTDILVGRTGWLECSTEQVGPVTFQWRKDGVPVVDDGRIRGSHTMRLVFEQAALGDNGCYDVVCTGGCGSATSEVGCLGVFCPADFNQDGFVDPLDYNGFINAFEAGDMSADFNDDGFLDPLDYNGFINAFEAGC